MALVGGLASLRHESIRCFGRRVIFHRFCPVDVSGLSGDWRSRLFPGEAWLLRIEAMLLLGGFLR